ncbi:MAG: hypothetical protein KAR47_20155 [Planctomycetes bacterium]|nr:hypothetical protein [Planctomycetota bacterium]
MEKKYSGVRIFGFIVMILGVSVAAMVVAALMKGKQLPDWFLAQLFLFVTMWVLRGVLKEMDNRLDRIERHVMKLKMRRHEEPLYEED